LRSGAPAVTPSVSAQAGNARPRFQHYRITALPNYQIVKGSLRSLLLLAYRVFYSSFVSGFFIGLTAFDHLHGIESSVFFLGSGTVCLS
jgi:hypothetical protein